MNIINKYPADGIGYDFIEKKYIPKGKDEYYLRNIQHPSSEYYPLTKAQIKLLTSNLNTSDDWNMIRVKKSFDASLVKNSRFFGLVRIGNLSAAIHEFQNIKTPVGIYNSTIISCDLGDQVCIDHVNYMSHYIIENDAILLNIHELSTTQTAKFGNGILKKGENRENQRINIEVANENGGRPILPFNGMLSGDAFIWSKYREDESLINKLTNFTEDKIGKERGYYGKVGNRSVIKNCNVIKDVLIGSDAYIKGVNKIKNITINSDAKRKTQIGEGCELVNGIIGYGCHIFYGVKAVRFILSDHSQLKYGARLINSFVGSNSTISCCEVLNSLIFSAHEQHHNNSFLCASTLLGQSNIPAGATIGSNHNSRSADGEIIAGRGFWPGLCTSLKHNSKFASFSMLAKGDFSYELNIPIPFCLISNDLTNNQLVVMPGYWFMYNMYALTRNAWKFQQRDQRIEKIQRIEYDFLAPDTINEIFSSLNILKKLKLDEKGNAVVHGWENNKRPTLVTKVNESIQIFNKMIVLYAGNMLLNHILSNKIKSFDEFKSSLSNPKRETWVNTGGQLIKKRSVDDLKKQIVSGKIQSWSEVHEFYLTQGKQYDLDKASHAYACILELWEIKKDAFDEKRLKQLLKEMITVKQWMIKQVIHSRSKDYTNPFRKITFESQAEMDQVLGKMKNNGFIKEETSRFELAKSKTMQLIKKWRL